MKTIDKLATKGVNTKKTGSKKSDAKDIMNPKTTPKLNLVNTISLKQAEIIAMTTKIKNNKSVTTVQLAFLTDSQRNDALKVINSLMSAGAALEVNMAPHQIDMNEKDSFNKKDADLFDGKKKAEGDAAKATEDRKKKSASKKTGEKIDWKTTANV